MEKRIRLKKVSSVVNRIKKECCDCATTKTIFRYQFRQMCQTITSFRNNKRGDSWEKAGTANKTSMCLPVQATNLGV